MQPESRCVAIVRASHSTSNTSNGLSLDRSPGARKPALSAFAHTPRYMCRWVYTGRVRALLATAPAPPRSSPPSSRAFSRLRTRITHAAHRRTAHVLITGIHSDWPPYYYNVDLPFVCFMYSCTVYILVLHVHYRGRTVLYTRVLYRVLDLVY